MATFGDIHQEFCLKLIELAGGELSCCLGLLRRVCYQSLRVVEYSKMTLMDARKADTSSRKPSQNAYTRLESRRKRSLKPSSSSKSYEKKKKEAQGTGINGFKLLAIVLGICNFYCW